MSAAVISLRIANAGAGHERRRIDEVVAVGINDDGGGGIRDRDAIRAGGELGFVAVAGGAHPEVEVRLGFRRAVAAGVLD